MYIKQAQLCFNEKISKPRFRHHCASLFQTQATMFVNGLARSPWVTSALIVSLFLVHCLCECKQVTSLKMKTKVLVNLNRLVGRNQQYVMVCVRVFRKQTNASGRVVRHALADPARDRAFLQCVLNEKDKLIPACIMSGSRFEREGNALFHKCTRSHLRPNGKGPDPRNFRRDRCFAFFVSYIGREVGGLWVCECVQPRYSVISGRAFFSTRFAPGTADAEVESIRNCAKDTTAQLKEVCNSSPSDFELLALQLLQVCCKRARKAGNAKFQCAAAVPNDVSDLKFSSFFGI